MQVPPKPANANPDPALALSVTEVPEAKLALQVPGQLIPAGVLVTVPVPVTVMVKCTCAGGGVVEFPPQPPSRDRLANKKTSCARTKWCSSTQSDGLVTEAST